jgi:hypothetical protein
MWCTQSAFRDNFTISTRVNKDGALSIILYIGPSYDGLQIWLSVDEAESLQFNLFAAIQEALTKDPVDAS